MDTPPLSLNLLSVSSSPQTLNLDIPSAPTAHFDSIKNPVGLPINASIEPITELIRDDLTKPLDVQSKNPHENESTTLICEESVHFELIATKKLNEVEACDIHSRPDFQEKSPIEEVSEVVNKDKDSSPPSTILVKRLRKGSIILPQIASQLEQNIKRLEPNTSSEAIHVPTVKTKALIALFEEKSKVVEEEEEDYEYEYVYEYEEENAMPVNSLKLSTFASVPAFNLKSLKSKTNARDLTSTPRRGALKRTQAQTPQDSEASTSKSRIKFKVAEIAEKEKEKEQMAAKEFRTLSEYDEPKVVIVQERIRGHLANKSFRKKLSLQKFRTHVAKELLETEKTFVKHLHCLVELYQNQLVFNTRVSTQPFLKSEQITQIFSNSQEIFQLNTQFCGELATAIQNWSMNTLIGNLLHNYVPFFKMYTIYCQNYDGALSLLQKLKQENTKFSNFLNQCEMHPDNKDLPLEALMITPIQRIPRYILLLKDLLKYTWKDHPDHDILHKTLRDLEAIATKINQSIKHSDSLQRVIQIHHSLQGDCQLILPGRTFVLEGPVQLCNLNNMKGQRFCSVWFFLFNDLVVWASHPTLISSRLSLYNPSIVAPNRKSANLNPNHSPQSAPRSGNAQSVGSIPAFLANSAKERAELELKYQGQLSLDSSVTLKDVGSDSELVMNAFHLSSSQGTITIECPSSDQKTRWVEAILGVISLFNNRRSIQISSPPSVQTHFFGLTGAIVGTSKLYKSISRSTLYHIEMKKSKRKNETYQVFHSYGEFENLRQQLELRHSNTNILALPSWKNERRTLTKKERRSFRRVILESFLLSLLSNPTLCSSPELILFLTPKYEEDFKYLSKNLKQTLLKAKQEAGLSLISHQQSKEGEST